jgi:hypothetical protein
VDYNGVFHRYNAILGPLSCLLQELYSVPRQARCAFRGAYHLIGGKSSAKKCSILLGGALMITQLGNRQATQDIDVVIATNDRRTYQAVQQAIILVAQEKKLPPAWLNDDVTIVVDQIGKPKAPKHWKTFGNLAVYVPEMEYMLALKLFSGRPQDDRDIRAIARRLSLQTRA